MANVTIDSRPAGSALDGTEAIPADQSGVTVKTTPAAIKTYIETGGTVTASDPVLDLTQTWNNGAVTFTGLKFNATNTTSASGSMLADLQVDGASKFAVTKASTITLDASSSITVPIAGGLGFGSSGNEAFRSEGSLGLGMKSGSLLWWTSSGTLGSYSSRDVVLVRGAAGVLQQRNGTNAQTLQVFGTYTDASNYVRGSLAASSTAVTLAAETAGTGADDVPVVISPGGVAQVEVGNGVQFTEITAPSAPAANKVILFAQDNGAGKTQLMALFPSGAAQQVAIEP